MTENRSIGDTFSMMSALTPFLIYPVHDLTDSSNRVPKSQLEMHVKRNKVELFSVEERKENLQLRLTKAEEKRKRKLDIKRPINPKGNDNEKNI